MKKNCTKCNVEKELDCFYRDKKGRFGVASQCKICIIDKHKENYKLDPNKVKNSSDKWAKANRNKVKKRVVKYQLANPDKVKESKEKYREANKEQIKVYNKKWNENNPDYRIKWYIDNKELTGNLRTFIGKIFKQNGYTKKSKTYEILGCSFEEFKIHIERQWLLTQNLDENSKVWMTWDNYGKFNNTPNFGWDIDHIKPLSSAKTEDELIKLCHYSNCQPLCGKVNRHVKKNKLNW